MQVSSMRMPEHMTDAELIERSYAGWPLALLLKYAWLCIPIVGVAAMITRAPLFFVCYILGCSLLVGLRLLFDLPKSPYRRELSYRKWKDEKSTWRGNDRAVARWSRERMAAPDAPAFLLTLRGVVLPNPRPFWMSFEIHPKGSRFEAYHGAPLDPVPDPTAPGRRDAAPVTRLTSAIDAPSFERILAFMREAASELHGGMPLEVLDGIPCALEVHQRELSTVRFDCNLAGPAPHPAKKLCRLLYLLGTRGLPSRPSFSAMARDGTSITGA